MPNRPPSTLEIARVAGVHQTTVSRALRNDHRLSEATRKRIQQIAEEMGYRPNPLVSALIALRRARHPPKFNATIAFVRVVRPELMHTRMDYLAGARAAADRQGFLVDEFIVGAHGLPEARLVKVLRARNIQGVVIAPLPSPERHFQLDWDALSSVVIGYTFDEPEFDRVVHDSYGGMRRIMHECARRDIARVGLLLTSDANIRTEHLNEAAYWIEQKSNPAFAPVPPLFLEAWDARVFGNWIDQHGIECVVTSNTLLPLVLAWCDGRGLTLGRDMNVVNINTFAETAHSGIVQDAATTGAMAARMVIEKITHNDRGVPSQRHTILTQGHWHEGSTIRPVAASKGASTPPAATARGR